MGTTSSSAASERAEVRIKVKIKKDDTVKVIAGRDKGKTGRVLEVDRGKAESWWKA